MTTLEEAKAEAIKRMDAEILKRTGGAAQGTITVRDYFAAAALEGMLCNGFIPSCAQPEGSVLQKYDYPAIAYKLADQMIEARK